MPTTYGNDIVYCLKSHCGVRGYCRQKWVLQVQIICKFSNERTCKRNKDVQGLSCGFEVNVNATHTATKLYNDYFRNAGDNKLSISLKYENNLDKITITGKSYWLRYGYIWNQETTANGDPKEVKISTKKVLQKPVIALHVDEVLNDGTIRNIEKPQTYFNEAK